MHDIYILGQFEDAELALEASPSSQLSSADADWLTRTPTELSFSADPSPVLSSRSIRVRRVASFSVASSSSVSSSDARVGQVRPFTALLAASVEASDAWIGPAYRATCSAVLLPNTGLVAIRSLTVSAQGGLEASDANLIHPVKFSNASASVVEGADAAADLDFSFRATPAPVLSATDSIAAFNYEFEATAECVLESSTYSTTQLFGCVSESTVLATTDWYPWLLLNPWENPDNFPLDTTLVVSIVPTSAPAPAIESSDANLQYAFKAACAPSLQSSGATANVSWEVEAATSCSADGSDPQLDNPICVVATAECSLEGAEPRLGSTFTPESLAQGSLEAVDISVSPWFTAAPAPSLRSKGLVAADARLRVRRDVGQTSQCVFESSDPALDTPIHLVSAIVAKLESSGVTPVGPNEFWADASSSLIGASAAVGIECPFEGAPPLYLRSSDARAIFLESATMPVARGGRTTPHGARYVLQNSPGQARYKSDSPPPSGAKYVYPEAE